MAVTGRQTPDHRTINDFRKQTAEPVIGNLKDRNGLRQFVLRGLAKIAGEWSLPCTAHNLLKLAAAAGRGRGRPKIERGGWLPTNDISSTR